MAHSPPPPSPFVFNTLRIQESLLDARRVVRALSRVEILVDAKQGPFPVIQRGPPSHMRAAHSSGWFA